MELIQRNYKENNKLYQTSSSHTRIQGVIKIRIYVHISEQRQGYVHI